MTDSQIRILDFGAKGTRKKGYCANPSHSTRVTGAITGLKSSHDYKREERQWSRSNRLAGHHPVDNRWIIRRVTEPPCKLVLAYKRVGRRRDACPSRFPFSFLRTLVLFKRAQRLDPFCFVGETRKGKKEEKEELRFNCGELRRRSISAEDWEDDVGVLAEWWSDFKNSSECIYCILFLYVIYVFYTYYFFIRECFICIIYNTW